MAGRSRLSQVYFNSNLVRLKVVMLQKHLVIEGIFQFQSGTIKGQNQEILLSIPILFQFQSGTIKGSPRRPSCSPPE